MGQREVGKVGNWHSLPSVPLCPLSPHQHCTDSPFLSPALLCCPACPACAPERSPSRVSGALGMWGHWGGVVRGGMEAVLGGGCFATAVGWIVCFAVGQLPPGMALLEQSRWVWAGEVGMWKHCWEGMGWWGGAQGWLPPLTPRVVCSERVGISSREPSRRGDGAEAEPGGEGAAWALRECGAAGWGGRNPARRHAGSHIEEGGGRAACGVCQ